jgi:hypothetical protein
VFSKNKRLVVFFVPLSVLLIAGILIRFILFRPCLVLTNRSNPKNLLCFDCKPNAEFIISYTHSVNKGRVKDFIKVSPDYSLTVEKTRFVSYGAGIPEPEEGQKFIKTDEYLEIQDINLNKPFFVQAVGVIANHAIEINGKIYYLRNYFKPQTSLRIEYKKVFLPVFLLKNCNRAGGVIDVR